jgi:hypothetical protein
LKCIVCTGGEPYGTDDVNNIPGSNFQLSRNQNVSVSYSSFLRAGKKHPWNFEIDKRVWFRCGIIDGNGRKCSVRVSSRLKIPLFSVSNCACAHVYILTKLKASIRPRSLTLFLPTQSWQKWVTTNGMFNPKMR